MIVVEHVESFLGPIEQGWPVSALGSPKAIQIIRTAGRFADASAYLTLGLSNHLLRSRVSDKLIRQELLILVRHADEDSFDAVGVLGQVAREVLDSHCALLRGDVVGPRTSLFRQATTNSLYVAMPVYLPDGFAQCELEGGSGSVVFPWLVPITEAESNYVKAKGWSKFEDILVERDPDLLDMKRASVL